MSKCELHKKVKAKHFCPVCLINERDRLKIAIADIIVHIHSEGRVSKWKISNWLESAIDPKPQEKR